MDKQAYIDAASRLSMCASFAIADANDGNPHAAEPSSHKQLRGRIAQCEEYIAKMREAIA